jgi:hypothetical protein
MAVWPQLAQRRLATEPVQRMVGMRDQHEAHAQQRLTDETGWNDAEDREIGPALSVCIRERIGAVAEHGFDDLDARGRALLAEAIQACQQQPRRKQHFDRDAQLGFPAGGKPLRRPLEPRRFIQQVARTMQQHPAGRRQHCLAPCDLESLHSELRFDLLDRVGHRRLALVQRHSRFRVAAGVDDRDQGAPLVQRDAGIEH